MAGGKQASSSLVAVLLPGSSERQYCRQQQAGMHLTAELIRIHVCGRIVIRDWHAAGRRRGAALLASTVQAEVATKPICVAADSLHDQGTRSVNPQSQQDSQHLSDAMHIPCCHCTNVTRRVQPQL
jgi:hypothetical protein